MIRLIFSIMLGIGVLILNWLILGESSPFNNYFIWYVGIRNFRARLNIIPALIAAIIAGNPHGGSEIVFMMGVFMQWFIIGFGLWGLLIYAAPNNSFNRSAK